MVALQHAKLACCKRMVLLTSISECRVKEPGGTVLLGTSTGSASPGQIHTRPSLSTVGRCATLTPLHCTVLGILVHSPCELNVQPWYGHCTCPSTIVPAERGQARCAHSSRTHAA